MEKTGNGKKVRWRRWYRGIKPGYIASNFYFQVLPLNFLTYVVIEVQRREELHVNKSENKFRKKGDDFKI